MPSKYYETRKAYFQKWYKKNKKKYLKKSRETYKKNRKKYLARRKEIRVKDPERYKAYSKNWNKKTYNNITLVPFWQFLLRDTLPDLPL